MSLRTCGSRKQKDKSTSEEAAKIAREHHEGTAVPRGGSSSQGPLHPLDPCGIDGRLRGIRWSDTIRFQEESSPDITDWPVPLSRVKPARNLHIADEDEWINPRRRNKKLSFRWVGNTIFQMLPLGTTRDDVAGECFPSMPTIPYHDEHRETIVNGHEFTKSELGVIIAMVARPVGKKELAEHPDAQKSRDVEWDKPMSKRAWGMDKPRERADVSAEAVRQDRNAHVGRDFEPCVGKASELPRGNPSRKFKAQDESSNAASFSELGSTPASMEAGKVSQRGFASEHADISKLDVLCECYP